MPNVQTLSIPIATAEPETPSGDLGRAKRQLLQFGAGDSWEICDNCDMSDAQIEAGIRGKFQLVAVELDERRRRQWAAAEALELGSGGSIGGARQ